MPIPKGLLQVVLLQLSVKYLMIFLANVLTGLNLRWLMLLNGSTRFVVNNKVIIKSK